MSDIDPNARLLRTEAGNTELQTRARKLPQRLRTLLLLVDGKRSVAEVSKMALQAGAPTDGLQNLISEGFVALQTPSTETPPIKAEVSPRAVETPAVNILQAPTPAVSSASLTPEIHDSPVVAAPAVTISTTEQAFVATEQTVNDFPATQTIETPAAINKPVDPEGFEEAFPDTLMMGDPSLSENNAPEESIQEEILAPSSSISNLLSGETRVTQARMLLLNALKKYTPVAGAMLSVRVVRAKFREDLLELLEEVSLKLAKSDSPEEGARVIEQARELLTL
ncbi:MAG: hypothetical protein K1X48_07400 [Burkholderiaceae bacterium]|nr:hypothetical protein [Burkholderiaceae bacterium]